MKKDKNKGIQKAGKKETSIVRSSAAEVIFDGSNFIDVFAGKNGVGKSNLFESFIEIFRKRIKRANPRPGLLRSFPPHVRVHQFEMSGPCGK